MNIDLDVRLTLAFIAGLGVFLGEFIAGLAGIPVNTTVVTGSISLIGLTLVGGAVRGAIISTRENGGRSKEAHEE